MSDGFVAYNSNNEILISSDTRNLHLIAKLTNPTVTASTDGYGGLRFLTYTVQCSVTPVPFFTMPTGDYYGIMAVRNTSGTTWTIEIARSGTGSTYPEVYVFADPRAVTATDSHGMQVYRNDGTPSFDSRRRPLAITGGTNVSHPSNPRPSPGGGLTARYCGSNASSALAPTEENGGYAVGTMPTKPMFHYSSLAQAQRQIQFYDKDEDCSGFEYGICIGFEVTEEYWSTYWAFYRGGIRRSGSSLYAGWIVVDAACNWQTRFDEDFLGAIDTGGGGGSGGSWPYSNETINLSSTAVIVGDASRYD
jgi:hypothetical protein